MIPDDLRRVLADALLRVPNVSNSADGRRVLLAGIPQAAYLSRDSANALNDVMLIILQLEDNFGADQKWRLLTIIDNALHGVVGTALALEIRTIRDDLELALKQERPRQVSLAELAQPYRFDLRQPVLRCIFSLPPNGGLCGFVVPTPTHRLMRYFRDSLKHRGPEERIWKREEMGPPLEALIIDPIHTTVDVALKKACANKPLLQKKNVIWMAYVSEAADADALWRALQDAFAHPFDHHFVVIIGVPTVGANLPAGLVMLPSPIFTRREVSEWVSPIVERLAWQRTLIERWAGVMVTGFQDGQNGLPIERLYERLETHRDLLMQNQTEEEAFMASLSDLEITGE